MYNIIEIKDDDEYGYPCSYYFESLSVTDCGNIVVNITENPLSAKKFSYIESEVAKTSVVKLIKDLMKTSKVTIKTLEITVK